MSYPIHFDIADVFPEHAVNDRMCWLILPMESSEMDLQWEQWLKDIAIDHRCSIAAVTGVSWETDLAPWDAPGIGKGMLKGGAPAFLTAFTERIIPAVEEAVDVKERYLVGVSLSGLFAVWASAFCDCFTGIGSVSGSLWYDGFEEWFSGITVSQCVKHYYLSLGDRERFSRDLRVRDVEERTRKIASMLAGNGREVTFEMNPGTHFSPLRPRLEKALVSLLDH